jgi:uncharacterized protein (TIGR02118 family)
MVKFMVVLFRKPDLTVEDFRANLRSIHGPMAERMPGLRRYIQNHVAADPSRAHPGWDAIVELYWDDRPSMEAAWRSPEGEAATRHLEELSTYRRALGPLSMKKSAADSSSL